MLDRHTKEFCQGDCGTLRIKDSRQGPLCRRCKSAAIAERNGRLKLVLILSKALLAAFREMEPLPLTRFRRGGKAKSLKHHREIRRLAQHRKGLKYGFGNHRRRAKRLKVPYQNINFRLVWERDGGICKLCGKETPWELRGKIHPDAPELGHIVPVSRGGPHSYENVECECRDCNGNKGSQTNEEYQCLTDPQGAAATALG